MVYPFRNVELRWQKAWQDENCFAINNHTQSAKSYILEMFPYPSGRLHMGHVRNYTIGDTIARFWRAQGYSVLHPMGWDAFGLPAENAASQHKTSPATWTFENIEAMRDQLKSLGFAFDWDREIATCTPEYYGHEQKIFLDFYQKGLVYRKDSWVNWDPVDGSVLANEQVINGRGWRSGALVEKRKLNQWFVKITHYADELLEDLKTLTGWPEKVVRMQENWIGRSEGALIRFKIANSDQKLEVFTTRPETLFGASFCAIAPVHPIAEELALTNPDLKAFIEECQRTPTSEEALSTAEKKGFATNLQIVHPFIPNKTLPLYVANFVLMDYGTGAIFACPAHDERDFDFATQYGLPIIPVVSVDGTSVDSLKEAYTGPGVMIHSDFLNGLDAPTARTKAINQLVALGMGERKITYRLRDWCVSRQRYWGCPIPIIHCPNCGDVPVPDDQLPVVLPEDVTFTQGGNPLENHPTWKHTTCPKCEAKALRETDTLDTFFESSWYFFRFCNPHYQHPIDTKAANEWLPVDWYIGGIEHAVLHLLYARFFTKALRDCGYTSIREPFKNLLTQGMVCHQTYKDQEGNWLFPHEVIKVGENQFVTTKDQKPVILGRSEKMSKSKKNVVDPNFIIETYGADAARLFVMSDTPPERDFEWSEEGIEGAWRYLNRLWRLGEQVSALKDRPGSDHASEKLRRQTHQTILKFQESYQRNGFNKVIAFGRELTRSLEDGLDDEQISGFSLLEGFQVLIQGLGPLIPHICAELWSMIGQNTFLLDSPWPKADPELSKQAEVNIAVQVNGKMRGTFMAAANTDETILLESALSLPAVQKDLNGRSIKRSIIIPNRIVNLVA